ncbi:hypothetical protein X777_01488, partial [Ooceraea biroi]
VPGIGALRKAWLLATRNEAMMKRYHASAIIMDRSDHSAILKLRSVAQPLTRALWRFLMLSSRGDVRIALDVVTRMTNQPRERKEGKNERMNERFSCLSRFIAFLLRVAARLRDFADFSDRLASSELLVFLPGVS